MKKLILGLALSVLTLGLQAAESKPAKDSKAADTKTPSCCQKMSSSCEKACCTKSVPKVQSPKGAEQSGK